MQIQRLELVPYGLRFREPYITARGRLDGRELLLLRLWTDEGPVGLGEAAPLALRGGPSLAQIAAELERCRRDLEGVNVGRDRDPVALLHPCREAGLSRQALSALDIAFHDLVGKLREEPVWRLLGADRAAPVACNATLSTGSPSAVAGDAEDWAGRGFESFKLKLGGGDDVAQVAAVREALGSAARIRVDANASWDEQTATATLGRLEPLDLELAEQPVASLEEMARVRSSTPIPLAADESVVSADDARRALELGACELATVKLAKAGGISAALEIAAAIPVYLSSALDGPVGIAAAAHAAQAGTRSGMAGGLAQGLATGELFDGTIAAAGAWLDGPMLTIADGPGLGVEIDEAALDRSRL